MPNMLVKNVGIIMLEIVLMSGLSIDTFNEITCIDNVKPIFEESIKNVEYDGIPSQVQVMIKDQDKILQEAALKRLIKEKNIVD